MSTVSFISGLQIPLFGEDFTSFAQAQCFVFGISVLGGNVVKIELRLPMLPKIGINSREIERQSGIMRVSLLHFYFKIKISELGRRLPKRGMAGKASDNIRHLCCYNLHHYFDQHVCLSMRLCVCLWVRLSQNFFFLLKSPWNHPLTPGVDPRG